MRGIDRQLKTMVALLCIVVLAILQAGCGGGGGGGVTPPASARITCADVYNAGEASACPGPVTLLQWIASAHTQDRDAGAVSRGQPVETEQSVQNDGTTPFDGWIKVEFDAGCNGAPTWEVMPMQRITVPAETLRNLSAGGTCGDMPLGDHVLTATIYEADGATIRDQVRVFFTLTR